MQYKTIILQFLQDRPTLHHRLRESRQLLAAVNHCSTSLKKRHEELTETLARKSPGRNSRQLASEALEIALEELEANLPAEPPRPDQELLSLDAAMAFVLGHSQHG
jgi:hypothetical protein